LWRADESWFGLVTALSIDRTQVSKEGAAEGRSKTTTKQRRGSNRSSASSFGSAATGGSAGGNGGGRVGSASGSGDAGRGGSSKQQQHQRQWCDWEAAHFLLVRIRDGLATATQGLPFINAQMDVYCSVVGNTSVDAGCMIARLAIIQGQALVS
jgi:hypothetical protein